MSALQIVREALGKAESEQRKATAMDCIRRALDSAAPWWQTQGAEPKDGERIVNSPVEKETRPTAVAAGRKMEAMQRKAGSRPPAGKLPDTPKGMTMDAGGTVQNAGKVPAAPNGGPGGGKKPTTNAEMLSNELAAHDKKNHPGGYKGGRCKLRDKVAKTAEQLGVSRKQIKNLNGAGAKAGSEEDYVSKHWNEQDYATPEFKAYNEKRAELASRRDEAMKGASTEEERARVKEEFDGKFQTAKFEFFTQALKLSPEEAGSCAGLSEKLESDNPAVKEAAVEVVTAIAENKDGNAKPNQQAAAKALLEEAQQGEKGGGEKADGAETPAPEAPEAAEGEGSVPPDSSGGESAKPPAEAAAGQQPDESTAQFTDELKKLAPDKAQMIDKLSQNFDTLNDMLNDEQKKKFWDLNNGGDETAFYTFLGDECGFSADEVSALRDLTDAYRAANPEDYPEYAEQHKHDELLARVKKADKQLNNDVKRGRMSGIKNRLEIKGFSNEEIEQYMDAMGLTEDQKFAVMNDLPVPPKVPTAEELAQKKAEQTAAEKMDAYRKAHDQARKDKKLDDPETAQRLNDLLKEAMEAQKAAKNPAPAAPAAGEAPKASQAGTVPPDSTGGTTGGEKAETPAPAQAAKATKEEAAAQPEGDPVSEGTSPEDHAKVCKANPKSNCPFLKAHMAPEALAALDKPEGTHHASTGETAAPATGTAQPAAEPPSGSVPPDSTGGEPATASEATASAETAEGPTATPAPEAPNPAPPPLPAGPSEPLPEYTIPKVNGEEVELSDEEQKYLADLREAYNSEPSAEKRAEIEAAYSQFMADLDSQAAMLQAQADVEKDARAQAEEKKKPGFIRNVKNFFGGIAKSLRDPYVEVSPEMRNFYGLPNSGPVRQSDLEAARQARARQEAARDVASRSKADGGGEGGDGSSVHENGGVTAATGKPYTPVSDDFLIRGESKAGGLKDKDAVTGKIQGKLAEAGISAEGLAVEGGPFDTTYSLDTKKLSAKQAADLGDEIIYALKRGNDGDGIPNVSVSYDSGSRTLTVSVKHDEGERGNVAFADVYDSQLWKEAAEKGTLPFIMGEDDKGNPIIGDLEKLTHLLVAGKTGSGKSARLNTLLVSALMAKSPDDLQVLIVDPKKVEFGGFAKDPHLARPIATSAEEAAKLFDWTRQEHENRMSLLSKVNEATDLNVKNVADYNRLAKEGKIPGRFPQKIPQMILLVDEFGELMKGSDKSAVDQMGSLAALARASGIHLVAATQRPDSKVIDGTTKSNFPATMALSVKNKTAAGVVDVEGSEKLAVKGPFILKDADGKVTKGNGAYISDGEVGAYQKRAKASGASETPNGPTAPSTPNAPRPVAPDKRSAPTHVANMPDGMEVHKGPNGSLFFKYGGRQYKPAERRNPDGSVTKGWKLADGSDNRLYTIPQRPDSPAT